MGSIQTGTVNIFRKELQNSIDPWHAALALAGGQVKTIDVGEVQEVNRKKYFLLMTSAGFDVDVITRIHQPQQVRLQKGIFVNGKIAFQEFSGYQGNNMTVTIDDMRRYELNDKNKLILGIWGNSKRYAIFNLRPDAQLDDGMLEFTAIVGKSGKSILPGAIQLLTRSTKQESHVIFEKGKKYLVEATDTPILWQTNGEPEGILQPGHSFTIGIAEENLHILAPI